METTITIIKKETIKKIAVFSSLIGIAILIPAVIHYQPFTGTIVNATLFISTAIFAPEIAILVGLLPSIVALSSGLLPSIFVPIIPFIMIGNAILILVFNHLRKKNFAVGVILASLLKFIFLLSTSTLVINLLVKKELAKQVALMMSWPQFLTALAGGTIAYFLLKSLKKV